jgi:hypothetical protein
VIFLFIDCLSLAPISGANDANHTASIRKTHGENATLNFPETVETLFGLAVTEISGDNAMRIGER